jgi:hypothetical protein
MRTVRYTRRFRRDYRREKSGRHRRRLDADLLATVTMLAKDGAISITRPAASGAITAIATSDPISS